MSPIPSTCELGVLVLAAMSLAGALLFEATVQRRVDCFVLTSGQVMVDGSPTSGYLHRARNRPFP